VVWEPRYCIHTGNCLKNAPEVFDRARRPWIVVEAASADRIAQTVLTCPTGALHFRRLDEGEQEPVPTETTVQPQVNGPFFLCGNLTFLNANGEVTRRDTRAALCRCARSSNSPFCDGTHETVGFQSP
jgi:uncharacterized Fe-S cluster protein YjdI